MNTSTTPRRLTAIGAILAASLGVVLLGSGTAQAASTGSDADAVQTVMMTRPMHIVGYDAAVAAANGYKIVTDAQGIQHSVKIGSAGVVPDAVPVKVGACGSSYVFFNAAGHRSTNPRYVAVVSTGYDLVGPDVAPGVEGNWTVHVTDRAGVGRLFWGSAANRTFYWNATVDTFHSVTGYSTAAVDTSSWVLMQNGGFCTSSGPWDSTTLKN